MPLFLILFIIWMVKGDRSNWFTGKQFSTIKKWVIALVLLNIFSGIFPVMLVISMLFSPIIIPILIAVIAKKNKEKEKARVENTYKGSFNQYDDVTGRYSGKNSQGSMNTKVLNSILPKAASKRRKIIEKFNKKFDLTLTSEQIQRIVDASYYSREWEQEVEAMTKEYNTVHEWYQGKTAWLRAYIKAFIVQSISSDFEQQRDICIAELDQIFAGTDLAGAYSQEEKIRNINDKFYTEFDDVSFMIAYRFLERNGMKYELGNKQVLKYESETDILAKKYEQMPSR